MKLESIVPGSRLSGIHGDGPVEVIAARAYGTDAIEVTWKGVDGLGSRILYRSGRAPDRGGVAPGRRFAFDGDGRLFRLASEALRIRLAHLFDPYVAVNASQIEPLPHQLTAVYGAMLDRQPLRFLLADDPGAGKTVMAGPAHQGAPDPGKPRTLPDRRARAAWSNNGRTSSRTSSTSPSTS